MEKLDKLLNFNADGLIPAIAQQHDTGENLMMAWMNKEAIAKLWRRDKSATGPALVSRSGAKGKALVRFRSW